jgi:hypothetical protein
VTTVHVVLGAAVLTTSAAAALWGAWAWWHGDLARGFWRVLRTSQALLALQVALGAVLLLGGRDPARLHVLYGLLPVGVSFLAEQLRVVAADQVLARRQLPNARAMEGLPESEQRAIVREIVARETGVMAASALVVCLCAARAAGWLSLG